MGMKKRYTLQEQLLRKLILFICLPFFIILGTLALLLRRGINEEIVRSCAATVLQAANKIEIVMGTVNYCSSVLMLNRNTRSALNSILLDPWGYEAYEARYGLMWELQYLSNIALISYNADIAILAENMELIDRAGINRLNKDVQDKPWYRNTRAEKNVPFWHAAIEEVFPKQNQVQDLVMTRTILSYGESPPGIILIRLPGEFLWTSLHQEDLAYRGRFAIYARDGSLITSSGVPGDPIHVIDTSLDRWRSAKGKPAVGTEKGVFYVAYDLDISGCTLVFSADKDEVFALSRLINLIFPVSAVLIAGISVFLAIRISRQISSPLNHLIEDISKLDHRALSVRRQNNFTEIDELSKCFNDALTRIDLLIKEVRKESRLREETYFETLQAQINPHFLFNTLNTIRWTAMANGDEPVGDLLAELGIMLTAAYNHADKLLPLREEFRLLNSYASIMRARFGNTFDLIINGEPEAEACMVPKFSLQPLVENAILHGVRDIAEGVIKVSGFIRGGELWVSVYNNGPEADREKISQILRQEPEHTEHYTSIGLKNVNTRVKIEFGENYGLSIDQENREGFMIWLKVPRIGEGSC
jgi:sensor histidine kinase YesM